MVYQVIVLDVHYPAMYAGNVAKAADSVRNYGSRYLARGGSVIPLMGVGNPSVSSNVTLRLNKRKLTS